MKSRYRLETKARSMLRKSKMRERLQCRGYGGGIAASGPGDRQSNVRLKPVQP